MNRIEFAEGMKKHFGLKDSGRFIDVILLQATGQCTLDVLAFDDYLQKEYGNFGRNVSTSDFIKKKFGNAAEQWTVKAIEVL